MYYRDENNEWQKIVLEPSGDTLPIGSIAQFAGAETPTNWLFCNGQAVSRETYSELFAVIGTTYGDGNGSTTFNLPDFSSRSPMGLGTGTDGTNSETTTLGQEKGEYKHQLTVAELAAHKHTFNGNAPNQYISGSSGNYLVKYNTGAAASNYINETGEDEAHNTIHPVLGVNFIIKAKQSIGVVGTVTNDITDTNEDAVPNCETVKGYADKAIATYGVSNTSLEFISTSAYQYWQIPLNVKKSGAYDTDKFTFDDTAHTITIGEGVSKIKISAQCCITRGDGNYFKIYIKKNNTAMILEGADFRDWSSTSVSIVNRLLDVTEGDVITLGISTGSANTNKTYVFDNPDKSINITLEEVA